MGHNEANAPRSLDDNVPEKAHRTPSRARLRRSSNSNPMHFSWSNTPKRPPSLILTADSPDFDPTTIDHFKDEGYGVEYLPYDGEPKAYHQKLLRLHEPLELGETYAIVAYGKAASICLEACIKPMPKLVGLVAYYPSHLPPVNSSYPASLRVLIHEAGSQKFRTQRPTFIYPDTVPGFAEEDVNDYDKIGARLAWSRTIGCLRHAFGADVDLERVWEEHVALEFQTKDAAATMRTMVPEPYVNHVPTMTGGVGQRDLHRFYRDFFIPGNPPSLTMKLISRTVGTDRVVDEMHVKLKHTQEIPWLLPGVPPTGKTVEVALVSVVCIRGGKLSHEHVYWDQASVLMQIGLLDPKLVPKGFQTTDKGREKEVDRLPVVGPEGTWKVADEEDGDSNELIKNWKIANGTS